MKKYVHVEEGKNEELKRLIRDAARRPTEFSEDFFEQKVAHVEGDPIYINKKLLKALGMKEEDLKSKLSIFVDWRGKYSGEKYSSTMLGLLQHGRSLVEKKKVVDSDCREYFLECKGLGVPEKSIHKRSETIERCKDMVYGLVKEEKMWDDVSATNFLVEKEVKTPKIVAAERLKEIILANGEKVSVDELKRRGMIPPDFTPVLYWRVFEEYRRTDEVIEGDVETFSRKKHMSGDEYMRWWVETEAKNFARMHDAGKAHTNPIMNNLTLAGEIVDNDTTVDSFNVDKSYDIIVMLNSVSGFSKVLSNSEKEAIERQKLFLEKYFENRKELNEDELRLIHSNLMFQSAENQYYTKLTKVTEREFEKRFGEKLKAS